jgi:hypothetical protein
MPRIQDQAENAERYATASWSHALPPAPIKELLSGGKSGYSAVARAQTGSLRTAKFSGRNLSVRKPSDFAGTGT